MPRKPFKMSDLQRKLYFGMAQRAAAHLGVYSQDYRTQVMQEELGVTSSLEIKSAAEFDAIIRRFAVDAGDWAAAADAGLGDVKRVAFCVKVCAIQLMQLKGGATINAAQYLEGVLRQAHFASGWTGEAFYMDIPAKSLRSVFNILDSERRRLCRCYFGLGGLAIDYNIRYQKLPDGEMKKIPVERGYYAAQPFNLNISMRD